MIKGVRCPVTGEKVSTEDCLRCSVEFPFRCPWDTVTLASMLHNRNVKGLSVTEVMTDQIRRSLLTHLVDYYIEPQHGYYSARGRTIHDGQEIAAAKFLTDEVAVETEQRLHVSVAGYDVSGKFDIYYVRRGLLLDYKSTSRIPEEPRPNHIQQLNAYVYILRKNGYTVNEAGLVYMTFSKEEMMPVEIWPPDETEALLEELVAFYVEYLHEHKIPPRSACVDPQSAWVCRFCPFQRFCKEHPTEFVLPENWLNSEWREIWADVHDTATISEGLS